ncbi:hypothetical protein ACQ4PT_015760 [Festuca glaucescens]
MGLREAARGAEPGDTAKIWANRVLNSCGATGRHMGNRLGVIGLLYLEKEQFRELSVCINTIILSIPGVLFVLPDSHVDPEHKDYGGKGTSMWSIGMDDSSMFIQWAMETLQHEHHPAAAAAYADAGEVFPSLQELHCSELQNGKAPAAAQDGNRHRTTDSWSSGDSGCENSPGGAVVENGGWSSNCSVGSTTYPPGKVVHKLQQQSGMSIGGGGMGGGGELDHVCSCGDEQLDEVHGADLSPPSVPS